MDEGSVQRVSIGRQGTDTAVTILKREFDVLVALQNPQSVTTRLLGMGYSDTITTTVINQYFRNDTSAVPTPHRQCRPVQPVVHWPMASEALTPVTSFRAYGAPVVSDQLMVPMIRRWETLSLSLERRVTAVRNGVTPNERIRALAREFIELVVPVAGVGEPLSLEDTAALLDKPSQVLAVRQVWETVDAPARQLIEAFVKNEACSKTARIISSFADMRFLLKFSQFTLAFRDEVLHADHNSHWFVPGSTPAQVADRVHEYCCSVEEPIEGDFSNFDGSVSAWCQREVMNAVYHRFFAPRHLPELQRYTDMLISSPARAKNFGFRYDAGVGVKSGSPTTCDLNTVLNAFIQYVGVRQTFPELDSSTAFRSIGLAFGDDTLFDARYAPAWTKAAKQIGLSLKAERYNPEHGITFLARVFPDPVASTSSFQDPLRTWRKLHLTSRAPTIPLSSAAVDRVAGYLVTDAISPVTSEYCKLVERTHLPLAESADKRGKRRTVDREKPFWFTADGSWPQDPADRPLMEQVTAARIGIDIAELRAYVSSLTAAADVWSIPPLNHGSDEYPWKDTLDPEGLPGRDVVDPRSIHSKFKEDKETVNKQLPPENGKDGKHQESPTRGDGGAQVPGTPTPSGLDRPNSQGHGCGRDRTGSRDEQGGQDHQRSDGEAQLPQGGRASGRGRGDQRQRPSGGRRGGEFSHHGDNRQASGPRPASQRGGQHGRGGSFNRGRR